MRISKKTERRMAAYQQDLMEKHCEEVENMYRQTRGWRHDYRNHIQTMKAYLAMGRYEELSDYLDQLDADLNQVDTVIKTGNVMMDAVLNSKISVARAKQITVEAKATVPQQLSIAEVDLCVILGNLLDNAIEACMQIPEESRRFIRIYIDVLQGQLYLYVINARAGQLQRQAGSYLSTKSSREHGYGLMRMDRVVEKYHGYLDRQDEEGVFATEVLLPLEVTA
ncbi:MAG: GHKL domain-containing protein [Acetatifactor sp.]|nr:GHKL domain-containing protein [Acetatifactor sp.]